MLWRILLIYFHIFWWKNWTKIKSRITFLFLKNKIKFLKMESHGAYHFAWILFMNTLNNSEICHRLFLSWNIFCNMFQCLSVLNTNNNNVLRFSFLLSRFFKNSMFYAIAFSFFILWLLGLRKIKIYTFNWVVPMKYGIVINDPI